jgi:hypothetical protein
MPAAHGIVAAAVGVRRSSLRFQTVGDDAALMTLLRAIARGERARVSVLLVAAPQLAGATIGVGATRHGVWEVGGGSTASPNPVLGRKQDLPTAQQRRACRHDRDRRQRARCPFGVYFPGVRAKEGPLVARR